MYVITDFRQSVSDFKILSPKIAFANNLLKVYSMFSEHFTMSYNFGDFLFASLKEKAHKMGSILKGKNSLLKEKNLPFKS